MSENAPSIPKGHRHLPALGVLPLRHPNGSTHWIPPETLDATPFLPGGNACRIRDHCWCVCIYIYVNMQMYIYILYSYVLSCMLISKMQKHMICLGPFTDLHLAIFYPKINAPFVIHPWCHHAACCWRLYLTFKDTQPWTCFTQPTAINQKPNTEHPSHQGFQVHPKSFREKTHLYTSTKSKWLKSQCHWALKYFPLLVDFDLNLAGHSNNLGRSGGWTWKNPRWTALQQQLWVTLR